MLIRGKIPHLWVQTVSFESKTKWRPGADLYKGYDKGLERPSSRSRAFREGVCSMFSVSTRLIV